MSSRQLKLTSIDREKQLKVLIHSVCPFLSGSGELDVCDLCSKTGVEEGKKLGIKASEESFTSKDNDVKMTDAKESSDGSRELSSMFKRSLPKKRKKERKIPLIRNYRMMRVKTLVQELVRRALVQQDHQSNGSGESPVATCQDVLYPGIFLLLPLVSDLKVYEAGSAPIKISSASIFTRCLNLFL
ncbi:hypothetical protein ACOSQ4_020738 [Xanthoceras sorbifolium]